MIVLVICFHIFVRRWVYPLVSHTVQNTARMLKSELCQTVSSERERKRERERERKRE